jgi:hypothetical protein
MYEWATFLIGCCLGSFHPFCYRGLRRIFVSTGAIVLAGVAATVLSSEFQISWSYLALDLAEAAAGYAVGAALVHSIQRVRMNIALSKASWQRLLSR